MKSMGLQKFCGQIVNEKQIGEIAEIIKTFPRLSRTELANTICELFSLKRPNGKLKTVEFRFFLEELAEKRIICLPECRKQYANKGMAKIARTRKDDIRPAIRAKLKELSPYRL
jgi:hypothetical protein